MKFQKISECAVKSDEGFLLIPAGFLKYQVLISQTKTFMFWCEFSSEKSANIFIDSPPKWDSQEVISRDDFGTIAEIIGEGFSVKGCQVTFFRNPANHFYSNELVSIFDSEGGQWLDEISKDPDMSDATRFKLWKEGVDMFTSSNSIREFKRGAPLKNEYFGLIEKDDL